VHGPPVAAARRDVVDRFGVPLYAYRDETPAILDGLFALMDRFGDRVVSVCGNHEHARIGGRHTQKFHAKEPAHLEGRLSRAQVAELQRRFAAWPLAVRIAACGVVVTHGAPIPASVAEFERARFHGGAASEVLRHSLSAERAYAGGDARSSPRG